MLHKIGDNASELEKSTRFGQKGSSANQYRAMLTVMDEGQSMEEQLTQTRYRLPYTCLRIGEKEYAVLDQGLASERAAYHLNLAKNMLECSNAEQQSDLIDKELVLATDFGCQEAPFLLSMRILDTRLTTAYPVEDVAVLLKIAAERGCTEAAYRMACSYAGLQVFSEIELAAAEYFQSFDATERVRLAEYYFDKAIAAGHQRAVETLMMAYIDGRGYIPQNMSGFSHLCEQQCERGNQTVMLGYGAWLSGITLEGEPLLLEGVVLETNFEAGLEYLLIASRGYHLEKAEHALHLLCAIIDQGLWDGQDKKRFYQRIVSDAINGNQLLALYLAWYSLPLAQRAAIPNKLFERYQLNELAILVRDSEHDALAYLDIALFGSDEDMADVAKDVLSYVYGQHLDCNGALIVGDA